MKELVSVQSELKAPKNQKNDFGHYRYRSAEDILEAVKPILAKYDCHLTISDEIILIGDRYYIKATATIQKADGSISESVSAYAREEESKKGMDSSQLTGATSSYARKYALNGLFCIDDTKDADFTNTHGKEDVQQKSASKTTQKATSNPKADEIAVDLAEAKKGISKCKTAADLMEVWNVYKNLQGIAEFKQEMADAKKRLNIKK